jgi:dTDP-4-dehydrorhamnose 3,5-epimerase
MIRLPSAQLPIAGCAVVPAKPNPDGRGCLYEIYRANWPGAFQTVQWNACISKAGVVRGVHVHVDYDEYYTLLAGRGLLGLHDIRRDSPTAGESVTIDWRADDRCAVVIPRGVAHVLWFVEDAVLAFGLSRYWSADLDVVGCRWDDPALGFEIPEGTKSLSRRDSESGSYEEMLQSYERLLAATSRPSPRTATPCFDPCI